MEIPLAKWLSAAELEVKDSTFLNQYQMDNLHNSDDDLNFQSYTSEGHSYYPKNDHNLVNFPFEIPQTGTESPPNKPLKSNSWSSCTTEYTSTKASSSSSPHLISFQNSSSPPPPPATAEQYHGLDCTIKPKNELDYEESMILIPPFLSDLDHSFQTQKYYCLQKFGHSVKRPFGAMSRSPLHAQDHVIAERKRREKLTQRFIALSAVLPGLKKMDKASVLGDAIRFVKQLQERVKTLEEQAAKSAGESRIIVKRTKVLVDDHHHEISSSLDESCNDKPLPEVEAKVSGKDVLIRIYCEKHKGCLVNILREIEKLHFTVVDSGVLQFGNSTLDITIVAQMDVEFCMKVKDLVSYLRQALLQFI
ncbi:transcription factor bHLH25 [Ziziphus jujuba]|uniref:Transcription factor bHLH25 n=1 Tax=Ziziphus jujuba TaxID=326968 RepID=A0ABM3IS56_ZIZJJ|nr:transcription factor bHLH25 [Ziziphus jujuba]